MMFRASSDKLRLSISSSVGGRRRLKMRSMASCIILPNSRLREGACGTQRRLLKYHFHGHSKKLFKSDTETFLSAYFSAVSLTSFDKSRAGASFFLFNSTRSRIKTSGGSSSITRASSLSPPFSDMEEYDKVQNRFAR